VSVAELEEAERVSRERGAGRLVTVQNQYSLLERGIEADVVPACERLGVSVLPFFPLAKGLLSGKYRRGEKGPEGTRLAGSEPGSAEQFDVVERLEAFAAERGIGLVDVAVAGLAAQPAVGSVIAGATRPEQVRANVAALTWEPSAADLAELDRIAPSARP
jgi:aryl-alcohol dehydrogenase-like predicted oxidoreductase